MEAKDQVKAVDKDRVAEEAKAVDKAWAGEAAKVWAAAAWAASAGDPAVIVSVHRAAIPFLMNGACRAQRWPARPAVRS